MDHELTPEELEGLLPAYALDAVDDDERVAIEARLERDPDARAEATAFQRAASLLGHTGGPPPRAVWERLEAAISATRPDLARTAPPIPIGRARSRRSRRVGWLAAAAAVAALAAGGVVAIADPADQQPASQQSALARAARAAGDVPGARHVALKDTNGQTLATAVMLPDGTGYLDAHLPALASDRTYQLWGLGDTAPISLGVLGPHPKLVAFKAAGSPHGLAISDEAGGGAVQPSQTPAAAGDFT
jgi:anti-sigma-K factor RskA